MIKTKKPRKRKSLGMKRWMEPLKPLLDLLFIALEFLQTKVRFKEMTPRKRKRQLSSTPPLDIVTCKAIEQLLHKLD